jgi:hypothetical protein
VNVYQIDHCPTLARFGVTPIQRTICELRLSGLSGLSYTQIIELTPDIPYNWQIEMRRVGGSRLRLEHPSRSWKASRPLSPRRAPFSLQLPT